ncbi:hypothetical protein [Calothrix sp. CCY 0018]|uniref:hypothetical protein n=1 Tax=Calothrix sp. CCY 0018 TaxID=3103864 RepID=UPI0039C5FC1D
MKNNLISASLSTQNLIFRPTEPPVSFEVTVNNDSDRFANFQLEIEAAGEKQSSEYRWYRLEPEIAAAQPHGSSTKFQVFIFNTPIPGFVGTVNLMVKVFSPQLGRECRLLLRLQIERDKSPNLISVELPVREFQVYPVNTVDILVRLRNMGQQPANVVLRFAGIDSSWLMGSAERRLSINPGLQAEVTFQCQPPSVVQAPSQIYPFSVEATSPNSYPANAAGNLEVLPVGFIKFSTPQHRQTLPPGSRWLLDWKSKTVVYELLFKNASNLRQEINLQIQGRDWRKCTFKKYPETANLDLGQTAKINLEVSKKRPWIGIGKTLLLEARPELFDQRLGSTDPATQSLELEVLPIIPLWLQLAIAALIAALLALLLRQSPPQHQASVNSVRVSGTSSQVVSGSDDCTLRVWRIGTSTLKPDETVGSNVQPLKTCGRSHKPQGLLEITNNPIRVLRFVPVENDIVAVGLDNGVIELRNIPTGRKISQLQDSQDFGDRVLDLAFTTDSLNLFSGYGSGKLRVWSRSLVNEQWQTEPKVFDIKKQQKALTDFQIRALTLSPDDKSLIIAGNFRRFLVLPVNQILSSNLLKDLSVQKTAQDGQSEGQEDYIWGLAFAPNSNSPENKILATSDSLGFITTWDLKQCNPARIEQDNSDLNCKLLARWQDESQSFVRSLAFSEDSSYLVSGGDDGRVVVWYLKDDYTLDKTKSPNGKTIYKSDKKINSIDVKNNFVISGSEDFQVRLHRIK